MNKFELSEKYGVKPHVIDVVRNLPHGYSLAVHQFEDGPYVDVTNHRGVSIYSFDPLGLIVICMRGAWISRLGFTL